jgi:Asp-tRNA(Asn)/Glu-tRNA(Gln) amidotransferase B subunit
MIPSKAAQVKFCETELRLAQLKATAVSRMRQKLPRLNPVKLEKLIREYKLQVKLWRDLVKEAKALPE